jgi:hypothetical protein
MGAKVGHAAASYEVWTEKIISLKEVLCKIYRVEKKAA